MYEKIKIANIYIYRLQKKEGIKRATELLFLWA